MNMATPDGGDSAAARSWPGVLTLSCAVRT